MNHGVFDYRIIEDDFDCPREADNQGRGGQFGGSGAEFAGNSVRAESAQQGGKPRQSQKDGPQFGQEPTPARYAEDE